MWNSYNMNFKKTYFRTVTDQRGYLEKKNTCDSVQEDPG